MPSRMIDFEALWSSDKLAACAEWAQGEYSWLYGLADAHGSFELTNLRVVFGKVSAIRKNLSLERLEQIFDEFHDKGLLFIWQVGGKKYAHWSGSDREGRLPPPSQRDRYKKFAPPVPKDQLAAYLQAFSRRDVQPHLESPPGQAGKHPDDIRSASGGPPDREGLVLVREGFGKGRVEPSSEPGGPDKASEPLSRSKQPSEDALRLTRLLRERILQNNPKARLTEAQEQNWAVEADRMLRLDGRTPQDIAELIEWCQRDSFWRTNILSMGKLREKFDQLTMKKNQPRGRSDGKPVSRDEIVQREIDHQRRKLAAT